MSARFQGRRLSPTRGSYDNLRSISEVPTRCGSLQVLLPGDYVLLIIAKTKHLFFCDPRGALRHSACHPTEGYITEHRDQTVSAGPSIPSRFGGWEGRLERGVWIEEPADEEDRERLRLPPSLSARELLVAAAV